MNTSELLTQHLILQSVYDAIIVIDLQSRILVWNYAAEQIYGWPERDVLGRISTILSRLCATWARLLIPQKSEQSLHERASGLVA